MNQKLNLIILDTDVIITLFKLKYWCAIIKNYQVKIAESVFEELQFYENELGVKVYINKKIIQEHPNISIISCNTDQLNSLNEEFCKLGLPSMIEIQGRG